MNRLLQELELARVGPERVVLQPVRLYLEKSIIAPARRFVWPLLRKRRFEVGGMRYEDLHLIPQLYLDRALMTQVVFNLLENAIKYAQESRDLFMIRIEGRKTDSGFEVSFKDRGIGIPPGWESRIFEPGVRAPNARQTVEFGDGYGLYFARELVRRHLGDLEYRRHDDWTEFVIVLPRSLATAPPPSVSK
jgi:signal transduction histidine kinase